MTGDRVYRKGRKEREEERTGEFSILNFAALAFFAVDSRVS